MHRRFGWKFWSFVVGAAPLDPALEEFWGKLGYVVIQGYGLTETAPVATLNHPFDSRKGTVGKAIGGVEIRIAPDGEVLLRGENITPGYYGEGSHCAIAEGWLHTGDIGELDSEQPPENSRPQERNDRFARRPERVSRRCRARSERDRRRARIGRGGGKARRARTGARRAGSRTRMRRARPS